MLKERKLKVKRFDLSGYLSDYYDGYFVEIEETKDTYEVWIGKKDVGLKNYMFGLTKKDLNKYAFEFYGVDMTTNDTYGCALDIIEDNITEYIAIFEDDQKALEDARENEWKEEDE